MFGIDRILALDIGASKLAIAEFTPLKPRGLELTKYAVTTLGMQPDSEADSSSYIVSAIRDLLRENGIRPGPVMMSISGQHVIPRYVPLPPVSPDKIPQIVRYEAQQNVPFPIDEVVWDYQLISQEGGQMSVILVAVKADVVKNITNCVEAAGLEPEIVDVSPMTLYNTVRYNYADLPGCTMVLDIGARSTTMVFVEGTRIFIRSIPVAGIAMTKDIMKEFNLSYEDAEQLKLAHAFVGFGGAYEGSEVGVADKASKIIRNVMTRLHSEVNRTINFYRSQQGGGQPSMVLLTGGSCIIPHANTFLKEKLKVEVDYLNPFRNIPVSESIPGDQIGGQVHLLGETVGLALRKVLSCPIEINLLPPDLVARKVFHRRIPFLAVAAIGLILIMLVSWVYLLRISKMTDDRLVKVDQRIRELTQPDTELTTLEQQKADVMQRFTREADLLLLRTQWLHILRDIHSHLNEGLWLTAIKPLAKTDGGVTTTNLFIRGYGFKDKITDKAIEDFAVSLKGTRYFSDDVQIRNIKPVPETDYVTEFSIEIGLRTPTNIVSTIIEDGMTPGSPPTKDGTTSAATGTVAAAAGAAAAAAPAPVIPAPAPDPTNAPAAVALIPADVPAPATNAIPPATPAPAKPAVTPAITNKPATTPPPAATEPAVTNKPAPAPAREKAASRPPTPGTPSPAKPAAGGKPPP